MNTWLRTYEEKLYIITEPKVLKGKPELSEKAEAFITALTKTKTDEDLLWFSGRYCTADVRNGNGDGFKLADLKNMYAYAIFKPVNWLHDEAKKIGFIVDSVMKEEKEESYVEITGVIWCSTGYEANYANAVIDYFDKNQLGLSMETMGNKVLCSQCNKEFAIHSGDPEKPYSHYCEHLKSRRMSDVTRWILNPLFSGVGIIPARGRHQPADKNAWVCEIASLNEDETDEIEEHGEEDVKDMAEKQEVTYSKKQVDELVAANEVSVRKEYASLKTDLETAKSEKVELETKIEDMKTEADTKAGELTQKEDEIKTLTEAKDKLQDTVDTHDKAKADAEQTKFDTRVEELKAINDSVTDEVAENLKDSILDDEQYENVKSMFTKAEKKDTKDTTKGKVDLETPDDEHNVDSDKETIMNMLRLDESNKE